MNQRPLILVTPNAQREGSEFSDSSVSLSNRYSEAALAAGGLPWIMPCPPRLEVASEAIRRADGVLLTGGDDVHPRFYTRGLPALLRSKVMAPDPPRDLFEIALIRAALRQHKPILAICRGLQILNVAMGGTLVVDIGSQVAGALNHRRQDRKDQVVHDITITPGSLLGRTVGSRLGVNSCHHQAAGRIAPGLCVTAASRDGVVEALEWEPARAGRLPFLLAVQFHPERLAAKRQAHADLFEIFLEACSVMRKNQP